MDKLRLRFMTLALICVFVVLPAFAQDEESAEEEPYVNPIIETLDGLGGVPCDASDFTCVVLTVPLDYANPDSGETLDVMFGVLPATAPSLGLFVTATGGPGISGLSVAADYSSYFDPALLENFDLVFFDQRGIGFSNGLDCTEASAAYYQINLYPVVEAQEQAYIDATRDFVEACVEEMDGGGVLPYLGTGQAIQDLEQLRQAIGAPTVWLYGESYGTQYAQEYATAYPEVISGLILDGVVDLTLTGEDFYVQQTQAFNDTLTASLQACNENFDCARDFGTDAVAFYDDLSAELLTAPVSVDFPLPSGGSEPRQYTLSLLENSGYNAVYGRGGRAVFIRALAAAARGDMQPLLRLGYTDYGIDPQTMALDPAFGDGAAPYYLVECNDYSFFGGTPDERAQAWLDAGDPVEASVPRLSFIYYSDLPCAFWPVEGRAERLEPFTAGDYTTFILNSDVDPATPTSNGYDVYSRLDDAYMITMLGGPHVLYGRGELCPDVAVNAWMLDGTLPSSNEFICPGDVIAEYTPLSPAGQAGFEDIAAVMRAVDTEIQTLPEYGNWDVYTPVLVGCPLGGVMTFSASEDGERYAFAGCVFFDGVVMSGSGDWIYDETFTLDLTLSGVADGEVTYERDDAADMYTVTGTYGGEDITLRP